MYTGDDNTMATTNRDRHTSIGQTQTMTSMRWTVTDGQTSIRHTDNDIHDMDSDQLTDIDRQTVADIYIP